MPRLLLVRHGETEWNAAHRYQGQTDVALSETGIAQARKLALRLSPEAIDVVYASDLQRAWRTAEIVTSGRGLKLLPEPRLREMHFGLLEGLTFDEAREKHAEIIDAWMERHDQPLPGGEHPADFVDRISSVLQELQSDPADRSVLVVAHGGPLSEIMRLLLELPHTHRWAFLMSNGALSEVHLSNGMPYVRLWNDTCHLSMP